MSSVPIADVALTGSLVDVARLRATSDGDQDAYIYLDDGESSETRVSFAHLDRRARAIAAALRDANAEGKRALLLYPPDTSYILGLFGCMYAGTIAVPAYPPNPSRIQRTLPRLLAIMADCDAEIVLTTSPLMQLATGLFQLAPELAAKQWIATDTVDDARADDLPEVSVARDDIAFLQYTSGSTGAPKGVMLTHGNLLHNLGLISQAFQITRESVGVTWLPPYHDMGLIGGILAPLINGRPTVLMSPLAFLQRPLRWLKAISKYRATISGGPNFAYELCMRKTTPEERAELDLSSWRLAFTGAEPVRADTVRRFSEMFAPCGFDTSAVYPCYGLAEATLIVSGGSVGAGATVGEFAAQGILENRIEEGPDDSGNVAKLVACGRPCGDQSLLIVSPEGQPLPADQVGELWVSGGSVAKGYWGKPWLTRDMFEATVPGSDRKYLRTGDLGFMKDGEVYITGRLKDLIVIRGKNHYPQDIERTVEECHPALRRGCCAAFSVDIQGDEKLVVVIEAERRRPHSKPPPGKRAEDRRKERPDGGYVVNIEADDQFDPDAIYAAVRHAVHQHHDLHVFDVVLLKPGHIPKTSSGKVRRKETLAEYRDGTLDIVVSGSLQAEGSTQITKVPQLDFTRALLAGDPEKRVAKVMRVVTGLIARALDTSRRNIKPESSVASLGLDSLMAMDVAHRIEEMIGTPVSVTSFLGAMTVEELSKRVLDKVVQNHAEQVPRDHVPRSEVRERSLADAATVPVEHVPHGTYVELSFAQRRFYTLQKLDTTKVAYNISGSAVLRGPLNVDAFKSAVREVVAHHEVLRAAFSPFPEGPRQMVSSTIDFEVEAREVPTPHEAIHAVLDTHEAELAAEPFVLDGGPMIRASLLRFAPEVHGFSVCLHHLVADGWSMGLFARQVAHAYHATIRGASAILPDNPVQYLDYAQWQSGASQPALAEQLDFWRAKLADLEPLELPLDGPADVDDLRSNRVSERLSRLTSDRLRAVSREHKATVFMSVAAALTMVLQRWTGQSDLAIGTPIANRPRADLRDLIGVFINSVVLRVNTEDDPSVSELVTRVRDVSLDAYAYQDVPFEQVLEAVKPLRRAGRTPFFDVFLNFMYSPLRDVQIPELSLQLRPISEPIARFLLSLYVEDDGQDLHLTLVHRAASFSSAQAERFMSHFVRAIEVVAHHPEQRLSTLELLDPDEVDRLLSAPRVSAQERGTVVEDFVERATAQPEHVAVRSGASALTYGQLLALTRKVTAAILARGIAPGTPVGVMVDRSVRLPAAVLGVLAAGCPFVPFSPSDPKERMRFVMKDSGVQLMVVDGVESQDSSLPHVHLDDLDEQAAEADVVAPGLEDLAYVIYTSGSTGRPKGVEVEHRQLASLLAAMQPVVNVTADDVWLGVTTLTFDISILELLLPLIQGACLVVATADECVDGAQLAARIESSQATVMQATPATWRILVDAGWSRPNLRALTGGEALATDLAASLAPATQQLVNVYGPTETTIWSTAATIEGDTVSIGGPLANTQIYVLDRWMQLAPEGAWGELYIGGHGVTRGYRNRAGLTATRFVPDPFSDEPGARMYRTGDRVRWSGGQLLFGGRLDFQVKIRGHRIELGEIEHVLRAHGRVNDAVVVARATKAGTRELVAYAEMGAGAAALPLPANLDKFLAERLPAYMLPRVVMLAELPRLPNGKLDRRSLPEPEVGAGANEPMGPRNAIEHVLSVVWEEVLGVEELSIVDDFFALGGNSLIANQIQSRLKRLLGIDVALRSLFEEPTIRGVAAAIEAHPRYEAALARAERIQLVLRMTDEEARQTLEAERSGSDG